MQTLLLFLFPFAGMLVVRLLSGKKAADQAALLLSLVTLVDTLWKLSMFNPAGGFQYVYDQYWIEELGISLKFGLDGIGMLMVLLTNALVPLIIYSAWNREIKNFKNFYSLIFLMQLALIGVFSSLDGFLFYVFWELALIPIWFICLLWGGYDRVRITLKFFIYTLSGSLLMLVGMIYLYLQTPGTHSFDIDSIYALSLSPEQQSWLFWAFFAAFAIKIPVFPLHTWQPDTYTVAPSQGTMLLSGIMLKMGLYGIIRWMLPIVPLGIAEWSWLAILLSVIGIVYGSAMAIAQTDFKRMVAYSSLAHVGLISAGIFSLSMMGVQGAVFQMLSHGLTAVGLFCVADMLRDRYQESEMQDMGGLAHQSNLFASGFMIILLGSVALPLTSGFVGEFMLLSGLYHYSSWLALFGGLTIIFGAVYMLRAYRTIMLGKATNASNSFRPLQLNEKIILATIAMLILALGIYPKPLLDIAEPSIKVILERTGETIL